MKPIPKKIAERIEELANKFCDEKKLPKPYSDQIVYEFYIESSKQVAQDLLGIIEDLREALEYIINESDSMGGGMRVTGYAKAKQALEKLNAKLGDE